MNNMSGSLYGQYALIPTSTRIVGKPGDWAGRHEVGLSLGINSRDGSGSHLLSVSGPI